MQKVVIDLYFNPANVCMYYTGTPAGTISLNYTVSNIKFKVEDTTSAQIGKSLSTQPLEFSYQEWYWQQYPLTPSAQSISIQLPNNFRWVNSVVAVIRKVSDVYAITGAAAPNKLKYYSSDVSEIVKANIRQQGQLRYPEPLSSSIDMMHEIKKVLPCTKYCDYFQDVKTNATTHSIFAFRLGRSISEGVESGVNCSNWSAPTYMEVTFKSALGNDNYVIGIISYHHI